MLGLPDLTHRRTYPSLRGSDLRQVPDTQEVFLSPDSDVSVVVEILERVAPDDPDEVAK